MQHSVLKLMSLISKKILCKSSNINEVIRPALTFFFYDKISQVQKVLKEPTSTKKNQKALKSTQKY